MTRLRGPSSSVPTTPPSTQTPERQHRENVEQPTPHPHPVYLDVITLPPRPPLVTRHAKSSRSAASELPCPKPRQGRKMTAHVVRRGKPARSGQARRGDRAAAYMCRYYAAPTHLPRPPSTAPNNPQIPPHPQLTSRHPRVIHMDWCACVAQARTATYSNLFRSFHPDLPNSRQNRTSALQVVRFLRKKRDTACIYRGPSRLPRSALAF